MSKRQWLLSLALLSAVAIGATPATLFAQPGQDRGRGGPGGFGGQFGGGGGTLGLVMRDEVQEELQLVDEQREKVAAATEEARDKMRDEMRDVFSQMRDLSDEERRAKFDEIRGRMETMNADLDARLKKMLLPHQYERLKQIGVQSQLQQRGASALSSGEVAEALKLTDEQREKLEQRAEEVQQELQEKTRQLRDEARNKMLEVLTPEQRAKLDELMGEQFELPEGEGRFRGRGGFGGFGRGGRDGGRDRGGEGERSRSNNESI